MAGFFFAFSFVSWAPSSACRRTKAQEAMQVINVVVLNPIFFAAFFGTAALCLALIVVAWLSCAYTGIDFCSCIPGKRALPQWAASWLRLIFNATPRQEALPAVPAEKRRRDERVETATYARVEVALEPRAVRLSRRVGAADDCGLCRVKARPSL